MRRVAVEENRVDADLKKTEMQLKQVEAQLKQNELLIKAMLAVANKGDGDANSVFTVHYDVKSVETEAY